MPAQVLNKALTLAAYVEKKDCSSLVEWVMEELKRVRREEGGGGGRGRRILSSRLCTS